VEGIEVFGKHRDAFARLLPARAPQNLFLKVCVLYGQVVRSIAQFRFSGASTASRAARRCRIRFLQLGRGSRSEAAPSGCWNAIPQLFPQTRTDEGFSRPGENLIRCLRAPFPRDNVVVGARALRSLPRGVFRQAAAARACPRHTVRIKSNKGISS